MLISALTPTGDRPKMLEICKGYVKRASSWVQRLGHVVEWVVVDDGDEAFDPGGAVYIRRAPDGGRSLPRNFLAGLPGCHGDVVVICEDDDWFSEDRFVEHLKALEHCSLHGWQNSLYYNVRERCWKYQGNTTHCSLFETAFVRSEVAPAVISTLRGNERYVDVWLWRRFNGVGYPNAGHCVGIKGGPGRPGLGVGHTRISGYVKDHDLKFLRSVIGADVAHYEGTWRPK